MRKVSKEKAARAVARGVVWLDAHVPRWRAKVDVETLDLHYPCTCILGQFDDDFYESVWNRKLSRAQVFKLGFSAAAGMKWSMLTSAWKRAIRQRDAAQGKRRSA